MSSKERYLKATAKVIYFDVSDLIVAWSKQCTNDYYQEQRHRSDCEQVYHEDCGNYIGGNKKYKE